MIGKQLNFYLTPADQLNLLEAINSNIGCVLIKRDDSRGYSAFAQFDKSKEDWAVAYLCEPSNADQVLSAVLSGSPDASVLLAIEFIQPMEEDGTIRRGRFWYTPKRRSGGELVHKSKGFVVWANAVMANTRHLLAPCGNGDWIGPEAKSRLEAGQLVLAA